MYGKTLDDFPERIDSFIDEFRGADMELLDKAFRQARGGIREFPTPADIRRLYNNLGEATSGATTRDILKRDEKPADWQALARVRLGVSDGQVAEWLEAGKEAQNEHIAKLEDDPEWRAMAARLGGFPGLKREVREEMTAARASKLAVENGWLE